MRPEIVKASGRWADEFRAIGSRLREAFGGLAARVDHIGSTSVSGLAAKDVIDVQVTVRDLDDPAIAAAIERTGFRLRTEIVSDHRPPGDDRADEEWRKRYADSHPGERRVHVHIRRDGSPNERYALLFRDYLRADASAAEAYERAKRALASVIDDTGVYADAKDPVCDLVMIAAERWVQTTGWEPGRSDA
ncbi:MAG: GrpB family protein [Actinomycetota bacterium]